MQIFNIFVYLHNLLGCTNVCDMKEMLYAVRCLKSIEDMILAFAGQFKQLSDEPEKFFRFIRQLLKLSSKCEDHIFN